MRNNVLHIWIVLVLLLLPINSVMSSSNIYDGVIEKVEGDILHIRVSNSPYSSVSSHSYMLTHKDGTFQHRKVPLDKFVTYYIDEIPVTREQMKAYLTQNPKTQMAMIANRKIWYFLSVSDRNKGNQIGFLHSLKDKVMTLERPQIAAKSLGIYSRDGGRKEKDGNTHLTYEYYPHRKTEIALNDDAIVKVGGDTLPWKNAGLQPDPMNDHEDPKREGSNTGGAGWLEPTRSFAINTQRKRNNIYVQAARPKQRIELLPPNYGDWETLVNNAESMCRQS